MLHDRVATAQEYAEIWEGYWRSLFTCWAVDVAMCRIYSLDIREAYPARGQGLRRNRASLA